MFNVRIIRLSAQTIGLLGNVARGVFDNEIRDDQARAFVAEPSHHMVLAVVEGQVVGMASAVVYLHPDKLPSLWINEVGVGDEWLRRGIGKRLMQGILELSTELGCEEAWLGTEPDNIPALALYRSLGEVEEEVGVYFTFDTEPD